MFKGILRTFALFVFFSASTGNALPYEKWLFPIYDTGRFLRYELVPKFHFHREQEAFPLKDFKLFGRKPFANNRLGRYAVPKRAVQTLRFAEDVTLPVIKKVFPGLLSRLESPTDTLYRVGLKRPLTEAENANLRKYREAERFQAMQEQRKRWPKCTKAMGMLGHFGTGLRVGIAGTTGLALWHAGRIYSDPGGTPNLMEYLEKPRYQIGKDEVHLIVETTPFPHLAIRVGDEVYSYGVSRLTVSPVETYLGSGHLQELQTWVVQMYAEEDKLSPLEREKLHELFPKKDWVPTEAPPEGDWKRQSSVAVAHTLGLDKLGRSVQVIPIRIGEEKVKALRERLEGNRGKEYDNRTLVNDCATMIARELELDNRLYDAAPGTFLTLLSAKRAIDPRIGAPLQIDLDPAENRTARIARNVYVNYLEGVVHVYSLPFNIFERGYMDLTKTDAERQYFAKGTQDLFIQLRKEAKDEVYALNRVILYRRRESALRRNPDPEARAQFLEVANEYFDRQIEQNTGITTRDGFTLQETIQAEVRKATFESLKREFNAP